MFVAVAVVVAVVVEAVDSSKLYKTRTKCILDCSHISLHFGCNGRWQDKLDLKQL